MDADRMDGLARQVSTRRGFLAGVVALVASLGAARRAGAYGYGICSPVGGVCAPGLGCCDGTACTFEYNAWVGRCGTLNADGTIAPPPPLAEEEVATEERRRGNGPKARQRRRREDRKAYRRRRKKGRL